MDIMNLSAVLSLNSSGFEASIDDAVDSANDMKGALDDMDSSVDGAEDDINGVSFGSFIANITSVADAAMAAATEFFNFVDGVASYGDTIDKQSQKMGISAESYQEWDQVMQHCGGSMSDMAMGMRQLETKASSMSSETTAAFNAIGISAEEAQNMTREELWEATIAGLQGVADEEERAALAADLFGERTAQNLGPLLNTTAEDTEKMRQAVHDLGGVMSDDAVKASATFKDSLQDLSLAVTGIQNSVATEFMPALTEIMNAFSTFLSGGGEDTEALAQAFAEGFGDMAEAAGTILGNLAAQIVLKAPDLLLGASSAIVSGLLVGITSLAGTFSDKIVRALFGDDFADKLAGAFDLNTATNAVEKYTKLLSPEGIQQAGAYGTDVDFYVAWAEAVQANTEEAFADLAAKYPQYFQTVTESAVPAAEGSAEEVASAYEEAMAEFMGEAGKGEETGAEAGKMPLEGGTADITPSEVTLDEATVEAIKVEANAALEQAMQSVSWSIPEPSIPAASEMAEKIKAWWEQVKEGVGKLSLGVNVGIGSGKNEGVSAPGHAQGLNYVPYNNYPMYAHEGEAILTKSEAAEWRRGNGGNGVNITQNIYAQKQSAAQLARNTRYEFERAALMGV